MYFNAFSHPLANFLFLFDDPKVVRNNNYIMKQQHCKNIRYCQKIKEIGCFMEVDTLMKKYRKMNANEQQGPINAEMKMREIDCCWKEGQEYDRTHHIYVEPKTTIPHFFTEPPADASPQLERYYTLLEKFVSKLKIEHQDETSYRIDLSQYPHLSEEGAQSEQPVIKSARIGLEHLLKLFRDATNEMEICYEDSRRASSDLMMEELDESGKSIFTFFNSVCANILHSHPEMEEEEGQMYYRRKEETIRFIAFVIEQFNMIKQSKMHMSVIAAQPEMGQLTYLMHPMCFSIYSLFLYQSLVKDAKKHKPKQYEDEPEIPLVYNYEKLPLGQQFLSIGDNFKADEDRHSRIVFINLDGYESEYTLEMVRNFSQHLMYISFPKYSTNHNDENYNKRFHKKILYYSTRPESSLLFQPDQAQELTLQREEILQNPEHYHQIIDNLYPKEKMEGISDINKNVFVFPIRMDNLRSEKQPETAYRDIEPYESHFVRFMFRDHLYAEILKFKPKTVVISYSGRINIEKQHFLQMTQEINKLCNKIIFFPNFTTALIKDKMVQYFDNYETMPAYDKVYMDIGQYLIPSLSNSLLEDKIRLQYTNNGSNPCETNLMDKLAIFMKVSSGHYNLNRPYEQLELQTKFYNCQIFSYIIHIFEALKNQYEHCKQRLRRSSLEIAKTTMEKGIEHHQSQLSKCVPIFYQELFEQIEKMIRDPKGIRGDFSNYKMLMQQWKQKVEDMGWTQKEEIKRWRQFRTAQSLSLANSKYHQSCYIQLHSQLPKTQYLSTKTDKMDDLDNTLKLSFCLRQHNTEIIKIYKETTIHHQIQQYKFKQSKNDFYAVVSQTFNLEESCYQVYVTRGKSNKKEQRCYLTPVVFRNGKGGIQLRSKFQMWTQWNYAETQNYILLYWPHQFDHVQHFLHKLLKKKYEPKLSQLIFICHKTYDFNPRDQKALFHQLNVPENLDIVPRWGCSSLFLEDQLFFFGGFHDREKSYLDLQNQISTLDLTNFMPSSNEQRKIFNLRKELYCGQAFNGHLREKRTPNSFVRPRMDFEFYDYDDLNLDSEVAEEGVRRVVMIGGFGQDFKTPHSLFIYYFYILRFEVATKRLLSVHKKYIRDNVVPINIRGMTKNRGVFEKINILDQRESNDDKQRRIREGISNNNHYFCHRALYAIKNGELVSKIKNFYAMELFSICKKDYRNFAQVVGQVRQVSEPEPMTIRKIQNNNHHLIVDFKDEQYPYSIYLELEGEEIEEVPLSHESIISIDTRKFTVYALVCHPIYTNNQTVLTMNTLVEPEPVSLEYSKHYALVLKQVHTFKRNLALHTLIVCNPNEVVLLQGLALGGNSCAEMLLKIKSKAQKDVRKDEIAPPTIESNGSESIQTFFSRKNNIITSYNFIAQQNRPEQVSLVVYTIDLNRFSQGWKELQVVNRIAFTNKGERLKISSLELRVQSYTNDSIFLKIDRKASKTSIKSYQIKLSAITGEKQEYEVAQIVGTGEQRFKHQYLLPSTFKTEEKCYDYNYLP